MGYYVMTATNKQYSYPRVVAIQIDVHHAGENPTNTPHAFHVWWTIRISRGPHIATFHKVINIDGQCHCSQEKGLLTQSTAR
jgi:hypothetical protein